MFIGYIDSYVGANPAEMQRQSLISYAEQNNFSIDLFYDKTFVNLKKDIMSDQKTVVFADTYCLGHSIEEIHQNLEFLYKNSFGIVVAKENMSLPYSEETKQIIAGIGMGIEIRKSFVSMVTRKALAEVTAKGIHLGRDFGCKNKRYKLDDHVEELKKYLAQGLSYLKIERLLNISWKTIRSYVECHPNLKEIVEKKAAGVDIDIETTLSVPSKNQIVLYSSRGVLNNADDQIRKMLDQGFSKSAIAEHFGVTRATLFKKLHQMGVETNRSSILVQFDEQKFIDLYQAGMSFIRMAKYFNCHVLTIKKHIFDLGLTRDKMIRAKSSNTRYQQLENSKDEIKQLFDAGWSYKKIADELNCDDTYICKLVKKWGWDKRNGAYSSYALDEHKSEIIKLVQQGFTVKQLALRYSVGCPTVVKSLERWGIEVKK